MAITNLGLLYVGGMSLLFVFWAYGIISFVLDVKNKFIPLMRRYWRGRQREKEATKREAERRERERQLY